MASDLDFSNFTLLFFFAQHGSIINQYKFVSRFFLNNSYMIESDYQTSIGVSYSQLVWYWYRTAVLKNILGQSYTNEI